MQAEILTTLSVLFSLTSVICLVSVAYYGLWVFVLKHFRIVKELLEISNSVNPKVQELKEARNKQKKRQLRKD